MASRINYVVDKESAYQNIIMASDSVDGHASSFTYGNEQVSVETDGNISYYRTDEQGSITQILSNTGAVQADILALMHLQKYKKCW